MKIPEIIQKTAKEEGCNRIVYIGKRRGKDAYGISYFDKDEILQMPTGLPTVCLYDGKTVDVIYGYEALELL